MDRYRFIFNDETGRFDEVDNFSHLPGVKLIDHWFYADGFVLVEFDAKDKEIFLTRLVTIIFESVFLPEWQGQTPLIYAHNCLTGIKCLVFPEYRNRIVQPKPSMVRYLNDLIKSISGGLQTIGFCDNVVFSEITTPKLSEHYSN